MRPMATGGGRSITTEDNFRGVSLKWLVEQRPDKMWPRKKEEKGEREEDMADASEH